LRMRPPVYNISCCVAVPCLQPCADCEAVLKCFKKPIDWQRLNVAGESRRQPRERKGKALAAQQSIPGLTHPGMMMDPRMWAGQPGVWGVAPAPGAAMFPGQAACMQAGAAQPTYIRNLSDIAQAQKRQALELLARSEWATALQAKAQQCVKAHPCPPIHVRFSLTNERSLICL
jgi:hypothetical protein